MTDYFDGQGANGAATVNGTAAPAVVAAGGDAGMEDEIMVRLHTTRPCSTKTQDLTAPQ